MTDQLDTDHLAIIGMAGRFPGAPDIPALWDLIVSAREGITRFDTASADATDGRGHIVPAKGLLDGAEMFDAGFFGIGAREAEVLDPQHRVFLETAWHALEDAGVDPHRFAGRIGVFAGSTMNGYMIFNVLRNRATQAAVGFYQTLLAGDKDFLATRAAYRLNLTGPAVTVQSACSSSLGAVHLAGQSILLGECDIAIAGGVSVSVPLESGYRYEPGGILSPDGHCRAFADDGAGTVASNGVGAVVLRRLSEAREAGDRVAAVVRGSAWNNDGAAKVGYTAPSISGQAEAIADALAVADVSAATVGLVEAHGTGTPLGDPIEIAALKRVFARDGAAPGSCVVGSVKSNLGHLDAAAGVTALIKAVLSLQHATLPPTLHAQHPNQALGLGSESPFRLVSSALPWPSGDVPRRAGVSSFGVGGTNVHVVLEEAPTPAPAITPAGDDRVVLLTISAADPTALAASTAALADQLDAHPALHLPDVAAHLAYRRTHLAHRSSVAVPSDGDAATLLRSAPSGSQRFEQPRLTFLLPGQGAQHAHMARGVYREHTAFRDAFDEVADAFAPVLGLDLRELVHGGDDRPSGDERLRSTELAQPALFAVHVALARLWGHSGITPDAYLGHSIGELSAAYLAGVFDLPDAVRLVTARGRLMQGAPTGSMLSVAASESDVRTLLAETRPVGVTVAAVNAPGFTVVGGPDVGIAAATTAFRAAGMATSTLHTSHAFHTAAMIDAAALFAGEVASVRLAQPTIPFLSNVTGTWITPAEATSPRYWADQIRACVRFSDAVEIILSEPEQVLLEVGPGDALSTFVRDHPGAENAAVISTLPHPRHRDRDRTQLVDAAGRMWAAGLPLAEFGPQPERVPTVALPPYPFTRHRYWIEPDPDVDATLGHTPRAAESRGSVHLPVWRRATPEPTIVDTTWLVIGDDAEILADRLRPTAALVETAHRTQHAARSSAQRLASQLAAEDTLRVVITPRTVTNDPSDMLGQKEFLDGLDMVRAVVESGARTHIDLLTIGVHDVTGAEPLSPAAAAYRGLAVVAPQESSGLTARLIDVDAASWSRSATLVDALRTPSDPPEIAVRGRAVWHPGLDVAPRSRGIRRLAGSPTVLITGGFGGVGAAVAEHLASTTDRPVLALVGRAVPPPAHEWPEHLRIHPPSDPISQRIALVQRLSDLGAEVLPIAADVSDPDQVRSAVTEARAVRGRIDGVVHAAGAPSVGMLTTKTPSDVEGVLGAKVRGAEVLIAECAHEADAIVLCSSITARLGGPGQSDYAAANAVLDTAAAQATGSVLSLQWDTWRGTGMAATSGRPSRPTGLPLAQHRLDGTRTATFVGTIESTDWVVDDHRMAGHGLVPGTTYLEMVAEAVADGHGDAGRGTVPAPFEISDVMFLQTVVVPDGHARSLEIELDGEDGLPQRFTVRSQRAGEAPVAHATGTVRIIDGATSDAPATLDDALVEFRASEVLDTAEAIAARLRLDMIEEGGELDFQFGPRWDCLRRVELDGDRLDVTLALPDDLVDDVAAYPLHPALLDVAGASARVHVRDVFYLPFSYRSIRVHRPLTARIRCVVKVDSAHGTGETMTCDTDIFDESGLLAVSIRGFTIKRINDVGAVHAQIADARAAAERPESGALAMLGAGMSRAQALAGFDDLLAQVALPTQAVISPRDVDALTRAARAITPESLADDPALATYGTRHPRPELPTPYTAPRSDMETAVVEIWGEVLGVEPVGVTDDFFGLGGHSLGAVQMASRVSARTGGDFELRDFFENPTAAHVAVLLTAGRSTVARSSTEVIAPDAGTIALSDELSVAADVSVDAMSEAELDELLAGVLVDPSPRSER